VASAYGTPSVVLFGPVGPERWGPPPGPHRSLTHPELRRGDRFGDEPDPALTSVDVDEVLAAAALVLGGAGPAAGQRATAPTGTDVPA
jgi:ADP-heptose:LPS heptosyltransferase